MPLDRGRAAGVVPVRKRNQEVTEKPAARLDLEADTARQPKLCVKGERAGEESRGEASATLSSKRKSPPAVALAGVVPVTRSD